MSELVPQSIDTWRAVRNASSMRGVAWSRAYGVLALVGLGVSAEIVSCTAPTEEGATSNAGQAGSSAVTGGGGGMGAGGSGAKSGAAGAGEKPCGPSSGAGGTAASTSGGQPGTGGHEAGESGAFGEGGGRAEACPAAEPFSAGIESCGQFAHRASAVACPIPARDEELSCLLAENAGFDDDTRCRSSLHGECLFELDECTRDADCASGAYCIRDEFEHNGDNYIEHRCVRPCRTDDDCAASELCACDYLVQNATRALVEIGRCLPSTCRADADCSVGMLCINPFNPRSLLDHSGGLTGFHCQSERDECHDGASCPNEQTDQCSYVPRCSYSTAEEHFICGQFLESDWC